jgi:alpha-L-rhamnosidase
MNDSSDRARVDWIADWIWLGDDTAPYHFHLFARKAFDLGEKPAHAAVHVTAGDRYLLYVNGTYLGRGPERCDPRHLSFDTHDVAHLLVGGRNCIAIHAYAYGCNSGTHRDGRAGLLAQLEMKGRSGARTIVATDGTWKARAAEGWRRDAKVVGIGVGVTEVLDARRDPPDWILPGFDDAAWQPALPVIAFSAEWSMPEPRHVPFMDESPVRPVKVLATGETLALDDSRSAVDVPEMMAREVMFPLALARLEGAERLAGPSAGAAAPALAATSPHALGDDVAEGLRDPFVLLDFGRQVNACPRIDVEGRAGDIVDIAYGEQLFGGRIVPLLMSTRCADRYVLRDGRQVHQSFEWRSFRYLQLSFRTSASPVRVHAVDAVGWRYPAEVRGRFTCSDPVTTQVWDACVRTTDLCTDDAFMDTPLRERRNWLGDGSHAVLGALSAWGDTPVIRRYFQLAVQGALGDGMLRMFFPGGDFPEKTKVVNTIPQHALVWACRVGEFYRHTGDRTFLASIAPTLEGLADWCDRHSNVDGLMDRLPYGCWLDWTPTDIRGANLGTNAFRLRLLDDLAWFAGELGRDADAGRWAAAAARLRGTLQERFWDPGHGRFCDSIIKGRQTGVASELGNALCVLFGVGDDAQRGRAVELLAAGSPGLAPSTSVFFHYVMLALAAAGRHAAALAELRRRFAPMMAVSGTVWEGWNRFAMLNQITHESRDVPEVVPDGRFEAYRGSYRPGAVSLAHCGGVGTGWVLLTEFLGVRPKAPGFEGCVVEPRVELFERASGVYPSPKGDIAVAWERGARGTELTIELPPGLAAELRVGGTSRDLAPGGHRLSVG